MTSELLIGMIVTLLGVVIGFVLNIRMLSVRYHLIEVLNGILYLSVYMKYGLHPVTLLYCFLLSALLAVSVIDLCTHEIPSGFHGFILILGLSAIVLDLQNRGRHLIGFFSVSLPLYLIYRLTKGRAIGGGDIKLMAVTGLVIGWQLNLLAFLLGCAAGAVIHLIRMKISKVSNVFALGPYLALGVYISILAGNEILAWCERVA